jgi:hypothetical protein
MSSNDDIYKGSRCTASYPEEVNYFEEAPLPYAVPRNG